jgi:hypothetical protein
VSKVGASVIEIIAVPMGHITVEATRSKIIIMLTSLLKRRDLRRLPILIDSIVIKRNTAHC